jgi:uncharacterized protein (TIGR03437 family)
MDAIEMAVFISVSPLPTIQIIPSLTTDSDSLDSVHDKLRHRVHDHLAEFCAVRPSLPTLPIHAFILSAACLSAQTLTTHTYGGSGSDAANRVTTDAAGNIYVAGTTTSFDLPLLNPAQSVNSGTQLLFSTDHGFTWMPLGNLPNPYTQYQQSQPLPIAVDPTNAAVFYVTFNGMIFKTTDSGQHFSSTVLVPLGDFEPISIVIDPSNPSTFYANTFSPGGLFKSTDAGATWSPAIAGLLAAGLGTLVIDPFHPKSLWITAGGDAFMSTDGANTWSQVSLPPPAINGQIFGFIFDSVTPGTLYVTGEANDSFYLLKSTDGGQKWAQLNTPFDPEVLLADPVRAGYLYALAAAGSQGASTLFYRSTDGAVTWQSFPFPSNYATSMAVDPGNSNIILAGSYRSNNGGETWSPTAVSRDIQIAFAPTGGGVVYASGPITSDIFLAKFKPDGKTLEFATYFGGMGNETATGVQVDVSGNIWTAGTTDSFDLPVSKHAMLKQLKGSTNLFLAEFSPQGQLLASTYLGGSQIDSIAALKLDANGDPWIFGQTSSPDFPLTTGSQPALQSGASYVFLAKVDSSASQLLYSAPIPNVDQAGGMSIDSAGNILLTGTTDSSDFPVTANVVHGKLPPGPSSPQAFVLKLDSGGNTTFSTYLGGSIGAGSSGIAVYLNFGPYSYGVAVTSDASGIYVAGNTNTTDFPTTPGAYQTQLKDACTYPSSAIDTGLIGTIYFYAVDDVFVTKLSPDAKTILYSTLLGGSCYDRPTDIAINPAGAVFVTGETNSIDFPLVHSVEAAPAVENYESFVSMLDPAGATLPYSSYLLAGSAPTLAVGPDGILYIAGDMGFDAQSVTFSGFPYPASNPMTKALLDALNVSAAPAGLNLTGATNAFSLLTGPIAPGEIVALTVPDFKPAQDINVGINERLPLGTTLGGTQVLFDGKPGPVVSIAQGKIVCITAQDFGTNQSTTIQVNANGVLSNPLQADFAPTALGLLSADGSGSGLANARNQDGTLNSPTNLAKRGSTVTVYFTGAGVPPAKVTINVPGLFRTYPLPGFLPGMYAAEFRAPKETSFTSPLNVTLSAAGSSSQTLLVYIE